MQPLVSVIIPAYNAEKYVGECLDSLLAQTHKNLQIIVVNDGSADGTKEILDSYAAKDSRIIPIHKENGGVSSARNMGLDAATGEYIHFCDADDWLEPNAYEIAVRNIDVHKVDIVAMNSILREEGVKPALRTTTLPGGKYNKVALMKYSLGVKGKRNIVTTCFMCVNDKVYRAKTIFREDGSHIRFDENMKYLEDGLFLMDVMLNVKMAYYEAKGLYNRRIHGESAMGKLDAAKLAQKMIDGYERLIESELASKNPIVKRYAKKAYARASLYYVRLNIKVDAMEAVAKIRERFRDDEKFQETVDGYLTKKGEGVN